ncbi:MAG: zinc ribbon domain-containing protein [Lachnospiraceae bacterium]|nr:zinc ribbon domain-containing protein [Lachnospiraceae bacterium]
MFCGNCGQPIQPEDCFCGNCGAKIIVKPEHTYRTQPSDEKPKQVQVRPSDEKPQQVQVKPSERKEEVSQPETRMPAFTAEYRKYVGIIAALAAFLGLFLPNIVINDFGLSSYLDISRPSYSYFALMSESDVTFMSLLAVGSIMLVILLQAGNLPLASLIGCAGMLFCAYMVTVAESGSRGTVDYGVGFWLFLFASIVCVFAAFFARRPKEKDIS